MTTTVSCVKNRGFSLVEVMIALVIFLFVFLALMQTALVSIDSNTRNLLRDEAVGIADARMVQLRNLAFTDAALTQNWPAGAVEAGIPSNARNLGNIIFTPRRTIRDLNVRNKQITVTVTWTWKNENYTHNISTIIRSPQ
ncbi:MAG: prepilin-type N-terminal cleavage/methylation domain-containing protein [Nitrospiraceae bacterium]|nr:prepilin-type N-terminal cleavage/methylation domain-containing protein [Nitrospiraceae bacterium]